MTFDKPIFFTKILGLDNKILLILTSGKIVLLNLKENKPEKINLGEAGNLAENFLLEKFIIVNLEILECQNRAILYVLKRNEPTDYFHTFFLIVDLDGYISGKAMCPAVGFESQQTVSSNFDGSRNFSICQDEEKKSFQLMYSYVYLEKTSKYEGNFERHPSTVPSVNFEEIPASICFAESKKMLFVCSRSGDFSSYEVNFKKEKKNKETVELELKKTFRLPILKKEEKHDLLQDTLFEMKLNYTQDYILARSKFSKVLIIKIDDFDLTVVKDYQLQEPITGISLNSTGRFLCTSGIFADSVVKIDLKPNDEEAFGEKYGLFEKIEESSEQDHRDLAKNEDTVEEKLEVLRYGNKRDFMAFLRNKYRHNNTKNNEFRNNDFMRQEQENRNKLGD